MNYFTLASLCHLHSISTVFLTSEGTCALSSSQFLSGRWHLPPFISPGLFAIGMSCSVLFLFPTIPENSSAQKASGGAQQGEGEHPQCNSQTRGVRAPVSVQGKEQATGFIQRVGPKIKIALIRGVSFLTVHQGKYKMEKEETRMNSVVLG